MISDDKRREVAEELRALDVSDLGDAGNVIDTIEESGELFALILHVANDYRPGLHYATSHFVARDAVELFADLIDPTCHMEPEGEGFRCSACGTYNDMSGFDEFPWPRCPECGSRVKVSNSMPLGGDGR